VVDISCGGYACVARYNDGSANAWGHNLGGGDISDIYGRANNPAVDLSGPGGAGGGTKSVVDISCGDYACAARYDDGSANVWGYQPWGGDIILANGGANNPAVDLSGPGGTGGGTKSVVDISCGQRVCAARYDDGSANVWGDASFGGDISYTRGAGVSAIGSQPNNPAVDLRGSVSWIVIDISCGIKTCTALFDTVVECPVDPVDPVDPVGPDPKFAGWVVDAAQLNDAGAIENLIKEGVGFKADAEMTKQIMGSFRPGGASSTIFESLPRAIRVKLADGFRKIAESAGDSTMAAALTDYICEEEPTSSLNVCSSIARVSEDPEPAASDPELAGSNGPDDQPGSKIMVFDSDADAGGAADGFGVALADLEPKNVDFDFDFDFEGTADGLDVTQEDPNGDKDYALVDHEAEVGGKKTRAAKSNQNVFKNPTEAKWSSAHELHSNSDTTAWVTIAVPSLMVAVFFVAGIVLVAATKATQKLAPLREEESPILGPDTIVGTVVCKTGCV
jgi:hypothetical protein